MSSWRCPTVLLCVYGFFSSLRPYEPFLTAFLLQEDKNLTLTQVVNEIYPIWTYSYLVLLVPVFLATDYLCYRPVLLLQAASLVVTYSVLLKARGVPAMQLVELFFGLATAADVAYYSYIYSVVEPARYQRVTGYCRGVSLLGSAAGSLLGQVLVSVLDVPLCYLVVLTLASSVAAFLAPWFLPVANKSLFFHNKDPAGAGAEPLGLLGDQAEDDAESKVPLSGEDGGVTTAVPGDSQATGGRRSGVLRLLWEDFLQSYSSRTLLAWSVWWALSTCGYFQVLNYAQALWEEVLPSQHSDIYNGYVETLSTLLGALAALAVGYVKVSWAVWGELALCVFSVVLAASIFVMDLVRNIWACYASYVLFRATYTLLITIATFQIAASLSMQRYALVFGVNTLVALLLQSLLTVVVVDSRGLGLDVFTQFLIYGCYFATIASVFLLAGLYRLASRRRSSSTPDVPDAGGDRLEDPSSSDRTRPL